MKTLLASAAITAALSASFVHAADVGVSISVGQPGFYGQIDIGDYPRPRVIYREPRIIERMEIDHPPIYMRVPPGHAKHWDKHCHEYGACNRRVYFVQDHWYNREYVPRYQERHRDRAEDNHNEHRNERDGEQHGKGKGNR